MRHSVDMKCQSWTNNLKAFVHLRRALATPHFPRLRSSTTAPNHGPRTPSENKRYLQVRMVNMQEPKESSAQIGCKFLAGLDQKLHDCLHSARL